MKIILYFLGIVTIVRAGFLGGGGGGTLDANVISDNGVLDDATILGVLKSLEGGHGASGGHGGGHVAAASQPRPVVARSAPTHSHVAAASQPRPVVARSAPTHSHVAAASQPRTTFAAAPASHGGNRGPLNDATIHSIISQIQNAASHGGSHAAASHPRPAVARPAVSHSHFAAASHPRPAVARPAVSHSHFAAASHPRPAVARPAVSHSHFAAASQPRPAVARPAVSHSHFAAASQPRAAVAAAPASHGGNRGPIDDATLLSIISQLGNGASHGGSHATAASQPRPAIVQAPIAAATRPRAAVARPATVSRRHQGGYIP